MAQPFTPPAPYYSTPDPYEERPTDRPAEPDDSDEPIHPEPRRELPVPSRTFVDRVQEIEGILLNLENGIFREASFLVDQTLRDERISAVTDTRLYGLLGLPFSLRPAGPSAKAQEVAELIQGTEDTPGLWQRMFPPAELAELMRWSLFLGAGLGEIRWDTQGDLWVPHLKVWHPNTLWWRWDTQHVDTGAYYVTTMDSDGGNLEIIPNDGQWVLHTPTGYRRSWLRGLLRSLARAYIGRYWTALVDWPRYNEVYGQPIRKVIVPGSASADEKNRFYRQVRNIGTEANLLIPARKSGMEKDEENYDVQLLEAKADSHKAFADWLDFIEKTISIRVLGHNLSSEVQSGALASAKVSELVRADLKRWDATTLSATLHEQVLRHFCQYNFGDPDLAPIPEWEIDPPEDTESKAKAVLDLGQGINYLVQAGAPIDLRAMLIEHGIPTLDEGVEPPQMPDKPKEGDTKSLSGRPKSPKRKR